MLFRPESCFWLDICVAVIQVAPAISTANASRGRSLVRTMAMAGDGTPGSLWEIVWETFRTSRHIVLDVSVCHKPGVVSVKVVASCGDVELPNWENQGWLL